jgi:hypothetical protein
MSLNVEMQKVSLSTFTSNFGQFKIHCVIMNELGMVDIFLAQSHMVGASSNDIILFVFVIMGIYDRFRRDVTDLYAVASIGRKF